jgi:hypothetical protein
MPGPIFVGCGRFRYRYQGVRVGLRCLWNAVRGFELAGYDHGPPIDGHGPPIACEPQTTERFTLGAKCMGRN